MAFGNSTVDFRPKINDLGEIPIGRAGRRHARVAVESPNGPKISANF
jgi:hypothetical protein